MNILTVCQHGNNRSVHFAHLLRYKYKEASVIAAGLLKLDKDTLHMLFEWADIIIVTETSLAPQIPKEYYDKIKIWNVGPDTYKRPFNPELLILCKKYIEENPL
jgi:predicted protein tyrosine phosphatase